MPPRLPLFLALAALPVQSARAQPTAMPTPAPAAPTLTPLYSFSVETFTSARVTNDEYVNHDGDKPSGLISPGDGFLYGTASQGGANGDGTVFKVRTDGTAFTVLHTFSDDIKRPIGWLAGGRPPMPTGAHPRPPWSHPATASCTARPGTAAHRVAGRSSACAGTGPASPSCTRSAPWRTAASTPTGSTPAPPWSRLATATCMGRRPPAVLALLGTVFKIRRDGTAFTVLHAFGRVNGVYVSADGISPMTALVLARRRLSVRHQQRRHL